MKQLLLLLLCSAMCIVATAQESFKKKYYIPGWKTFSEKDTVYLVKDKTYKFLDLPDSVKTKIRNRYPIGQKVTITKELNIDGEKRNITQEVTVNEAFYNSLSESLPERVDLTKTPFRGFVKFEENKVLVNPFLRKDHQGDFAEREIYYYKLKNRQRIHLKFTEWTVSTLIIPIKYRFKNGQVPEDFATAFNVNLFGGYSIGSTSFFHQEKVDNKSNTWKVTLGLLVGASVTELNASNTKYSNDPITGDVKYNKGLATVGLGTTFAYNKINFGVFYGWDFAVGESAERWDYNKQPWLGIALGYSLFNFN